MRGVKLLGGVREDLGTDRLGYWSLLGNTGDYQEARMVVWEGGPTMGMWLTLAVFFTTTLEGKEITQTTMSSC